MDCERNSNLSSTCVCVREFLVYEKFNHKIFGSDEKGTVENPKNYDSAHSKTIREC